MNESFEELLKILTSSMDLIRKLWGRLLDIDLNTFSKCPETGILAKVYATSRANVVIKHFAHAQSKTLCACVYLCGRFEHLYKPVAPVGWNENTHFWIWMNGSPRLATSVLTNCDVNSHTEWFHKSSFFDRRGGSCRCCAFKGCRFRRMLTITTMGHRWAQQPLSFLIESCWFQECVVTDKATAFWSPRSLPTHFKAEATCKSNP